jgi:hypothetical protein
MNFKSWVEMHLRPSFENLMDDIELSLKLTTFAFNMKLEVFWVLNSFLLFLRTYEEKKARKMLSLMFDLKLKFFCLVFSYVSKEQGMYIMESMIGEHCIPCWSNHTITYILLDMLLWFCRLGC